MKQASCNLMLTDDAAQPIRISRKISGLTVLSPSTVTTVYGSLVVRHYISSYHLVGRNAHHQVVIPCIGRRLASPSRYSLCSINAQLLSSIDVSRRQVPAHLYNDRSVPHPLHTHTQPHGICPHPAIFFLRQGIPVFPAHDTSKIRISLNQQAEHSG